MNKNQTSPEVRKPSNRKAFIVVSLMFAMFVVPYIYVLYIYKTGEIPIEGSTEKGVFFKPFIEMDNQSFTDINGEPWTTEKLNQKWAILNFADSDCEQKCLEGIFNTQQGISALTRNKGKVEQIILMHPQQSVSDDLNTIIGLKKNVHAIQNEELFVAVTEQMKVQGSLSLYRVIVDPEAKFLLFYTPENSLQEILRDIKRLLKASVTRYNS
jgi:cytochrome oxidase Cu insertion factor (SCO1/SenC/PrrC family)